MSTPPPNCPQCDQKYNIEWAMEVGHNIGERSPTLGQQTLLVFYVGYILDDKKHFM